MLEYRGSIGYYHGPCVIEDVYFGYQKGRYAIRVTGRNDFGDYDEFLYHVRPESIWIV